MTLWNKQYELLNEGIYGDEQVLMKNIVSCLKKEKLKVIL